MLEGLLYILMIASVFFSTGTLMILALSFFRKEKTGSDDKRPLSIIIAAHNEVRRLPSLLECLAKQDYPKHLMRVIVADDRSTDGTGAVAMDFSDRLSIQLVTIDAMPEGESPKKYALDRAIQHAGTDILLLTDSDCRPEPGWARRMSSAFSDDTDVVLGISPVNGAGGFPGRCAAYDSTRTALFSIGAARLGRPYMAVGRSWAYRKSLYERVGGFASITHHLGGDDDLLLQRFVADNARVSVCTSSNAFSRTDAHTTMRGFIRQKLRHLSVSKSYRGPAAALLAAFVAFEWLAIIAAPVFLLLIMNRFAPLVLLLLTTKLIMDALILFAVHRRLHPSTSLATLVTMIPLGLLHVVCNSILGLISYLRKPRW